MAIGLPMVEDLVEAVPRIGVAFHFSGLTGCISKPRHTTVSTPGDGKETELLLRPQRHEAERNVEFESRDVEKL